MRIHRKTFIALLSMVYLFISNVTSAEQVLKKVNIVSTVDDAEISIFLADIIFLSLLIPMKARMLTSTSPVVFLKQI
jgi:hypothetical protein